MTSPPSSRAGGVSWRSRAEGAGPADKVNRVEKCVLAEMFLSTEVCGLDKALRSSKAGAMWGGP